MKIINQLLKVSSIIFILVSCSNTNKKSRINENEIDNMFNRIKDSIVNTDIPVLTDISFVNYDNSGQLLSCDIREVFTDSKKKVYYSNNNNVINEILIDVNSKDTLVSRKVKNIENLVSIFFPNTWLNKLKKMDTLNKVSRDSIILKDNKKTCRIKIDANQLIIYESINAEKVESKTILKFFENTKNVQSQSLVVGNLKVYTLLFNMNGDIIKAIDYDNETTNKKIHLNIFIHLRS